MQISYVPLILKTAQFLRNEIGLDIHWPVFGVSEASLQEAKTGVQAQDCGVDFAGFATGISIRDALLSSDIYVHPSYIDNSPNSLYEARVLGLPVVSTNVAGISSLVEDAHNGSLVPTNDPYTMSWRITHLKENPDLAANISANAKALARDRHAPERIGSDLVTIYQKYRRQSK